MSTKTIEVPDIGTVKLSKRRGVKNLRLSISHDGAVRVSMPFWITFASGIDFVKKQHGWILSNQKKAMPLTDGLRIGKYHRLRFVPKKDASRTGSRIKSSGEVVITYPQNMEYENHSVQDVANKAAHRALKLQGEKLLAIKINELARLHGFTYRHFSVKKLKSRWGSCSSEKDIVLNIYLMQLPWHLIEYVIMHELTHTRIMTHGPIFWKELEKYVPNLKSVRKQIKIYQPSLMTDS